MRTFDRPLEVSATTMQGGADSGSVEFRVYDPKSETTIVAWRMSREEAWSLITGTYLRVDQGWTVSPERYAHVGKEMVTQMVELGWAPQRAGGEDGKAWAEEQAAKHPQADLFDEYSLRHTNHGWEAVYRRWIEGTEE